MSKVALVFGASGVSGWSFINEILNDYPKAEVWQEVHALNNRPLDADKTLWPQDGRLKVVSGIDLLNGTQEDLQATLKSKVQNIEKVTHVYYLAYKANTDFDQELQDAVAMFKRATTALDQLSPSLEFVVLQTGAKMYGCHLLDKHPNNKLIHVPLREDMPRLPDPYHDSLFYHPQLDWISAYARHKSWLWCDTRPDIVVGFHPTPNFYSLAQVLGIFMTLYRHVNGEHAICPFPGTPQSWTAKSIDASSDMIARQTLHLSLTLDPARKGEGFNVGDARQYSTWATKWPAICAYFGLQGVGPDTTEHGKGPEVRGYIKQHIEAWKDIERAHKLQNGFADSEIVFPGFEYFLLTQFDFDRQYDMGKMYDVAGFQEERTPSQTYGGVFDRMRAAKIIP